MTRDGRMAAGLLLPIVAAALFSLARLAAEGFDVPREEDYAAARALLEAEGFSAADHDAVAALPPWSLRPHAHLRGFAPLAADRLDEVPPDRFRRLFLWVEPDAEPWLLPLLGRLPAPRLDRQVGRVRVLGFDLGPPAATYDFRASLAEARVEVRAAQGSVRAACDQAIARGWQCRGRPEWQRAERKWQLVSENGQDAIWAHPPPRGERLVFRYEQVPLGDSLWLRAGHTRRGAERAKAPVTLEVWVDGAQVASFLHPVAFDYQSHEVRLAGGGGGPADVEFHVFTEDNGSNHFAWDAWTSRSTARPAGGGT